MRAWFDGQAPQRIAAPPQDRHVSVPPSTRVACTVGPVSNSFETLSEMLTAGMSVRPWGGGVPWGAPGTDDAAAPVTPASRPALRALRSVMHFVTDQFQWSGGFETVGGAAAATPMMMSTAFVHPPPH